MTQADTPKKIPARLLFEGQLAHLIALSALLLGLFAASALPGFHEGRFLGLSTWAWLVLTVADTIAHQVMVWFCWRVELHGKWLTRWFGDRAFPLYRVVFVILFAARMVPITLLAYANRATLPLDPAAGLVIALIIIIPAAYLFYSVRVYFSFNRAFGIDHFDASYRGAALVRQGIFKYTPNAMYVFGIGALWIPGFAFQSTAALVAALFSHLYIWVHYLCTERPDMARIYGKQAGAQ
jgi:hypothetical protein